MHYSENDLMLKVAEGNSHAFRHLMTQHLPKAHAVARRMLRSSQDADEAVQDAFRKTWVHAASFDPQKAAFGTWFYRILSRSCLDFVRKESPAHIDIEEIAEIIADNTPGQESLLMLQQAGEKVRQAVQSLPDRQRLAVILCYFEEMTNPEAAEIMELHLKALEGLLARARKTLRDMLIEDYRKAS